MVKSSFKKRVKE